MGEDPKRPYHAEVSGTSVTVRFEVLAVALCGAEKLATGMNSHVRVYDGDRLVKTVKPLRIPTITVY